MADSVGIDIVDVARMGRLLDRYGHRFVRRILGAGELAIFEQRLDRAVFLSGRFAAKEAVIKALGEYLKDRPSWAAVQILNDPAGRPRIELPTLWAERLSRITISVSISHERDYAIATAFCTETK